MGRQGARVDKMFRAVAVSLAALVAVSAQDMRENCVSCGDVKRRCEIDCMLPTYRVSQEVAWPHNAPESYADMSGCLTGCKSSYESCSETSEQTSCLSCVSSCSTTYEASMLGCLQALKDTTSKGTVDDSMDDCAITANVDMNTCSETCYTEDVYHGWTPATEEGEEGDATGMIDSVPNYRAGIPSYRKMNKVLSPNPELAATAVDVEAVSERMGVAGIVSLSSLLAMVILSVGMLTVSQLKRELTPDV